MKKDWKKKAEIAILFVFVFFFWMLPVQAPAFFEKQGQYGSIDLHGLIRGFGIYKKNPEDNIFYQEKSNSGTGVFARMIFQVQEKEELGLEINAYQTWVPSALLSQNSGLSGILDVERSSALEWSFSHDDFVHLAIDRMNINWSRDRLDLIFGRQPVNLATTFYFTPNDFFAPFAAQVFYRMYKPGVDAIRGEIRLGDFSQISLFSVFGYEKDPGGDTGWSEKPDFSRTSYLGRISTVFGGFEAAMMGGVIREENIIGGSLQGELFQWLGVRAEGHIADPHNFGNDAYEMLTVGLEHRWENSLNLRLEQFYNGPGAGSVADYGNTATKGEKPYLGHNYTALGAGYELTPLIQMEILAMTNLTDRSWILWLNGTCSLADEAELVFNFGVPVGETPRGADIRSEFGMYPYSANFELRYYF